MDYKKELHSEINANPELRTRMGFKVWLMELGDKIAELRKSLGYSQAAFAEKMDVSQTVIARIESCQNMKCSTLWKISDILDVDLKVFGVSKKEEMARFDQFYGLNTYQSGNEMLVLTSIISGDSTGILSHNTEGNTVGLLNDYQLTPSHS